MLLRSLILTGAIHGLFFIFLIKTKVKNADSDRLLMAWMAIVALQLLFYYDNLAIKPVFPGFLQLLSFSLPLLSSPVLYLYIYALSFGYRLKWKNSLVHLLPYLVFNAVTFCIYYGKAHDLFLKDGFPHLDHALSAWLVYSLTALLAIIPGYYTLLSLFVLVRYQKTLPDNYSYTEKINLNWLKWIVISLLVLFIGLFLFIKYGVYYGLVSYPNLFAVVGSVITVYVFFIGFMGLRQNTVLNDIAAQPPIQKEDITAPSYKNSGLSDEWLAQTYDKLRRHLNERKAFLQEDLTLSILAAQLQITPNQLSQVINQQSQTNFYNFINAYRVEAVKLKLKDPALAHYSILGLAYDCGFGSKSSFNKIFKEVTGQTPLQYQKAVS